MPNRYYSGQLTDHFNGKQFYHAGLLSTDKSLLDLLRWKIFGKQAPWPVTIPARSGLKPAPRVDGLRITAIGHSSMLIQVAATNILVDPVWSERASPFKWTGPRRHNPPAIALADLPPIHAVLVSHNHYDHMDLPTLRKVRTRWSPPVATGLGNAHHLAKAGIRSAVELDWWQTTELAGARVTYVPAQHFSSRGLYDRNRCLWGGFVVEAEGAVVYFAGDSGYCPHFAEIGRKFPRIDLALLPIGAYEPRWFMRQQHVNPQEAVQAHLDLKARRSLGMHFGTFQLTDEAIDAPVLALRQAQAMTGVANTEFDVLAFGETRQYPAQ